MRKPDRKQLRLDFERREECFSDALEMTFPERELSDAEKIAELNRLEQLASSFITPANPITDADVPF